MPSRRANQGEANWINWVLIKKEIMAPAIAQKMVVVSLVLNPLKVVKLESATLRFHTNIWWPGSATTTLI